MLTRVLPPETYDFLENYLPTQEENQRVHHSTKLTDAVFISSYKKMTALTSPKMLKNVFCNLTHAVV